MKIVYLSISIASNSSNSSSRIFFGGNDSCTMSSMTIIINWITRIVKKINPIHIINNPIVVIIDSICSAVQFILLTAQTGFIISWQTCCSL